MDTRAGTGAGTGAGQQQTPPSSGGGTATLPRLQDAQVNSLENVKQAFSDYSEQIDRAAFARRLGLTPSWNWSDVQTLVNRGRFTFDQIHRAMYEEIT